MVKKRKYTRALLEPLVKKNVSVSGVMRGLGFKTLQGGSHTYLSSVIRKWHIDTSHFTGRASNRGLSHKGGPEKKSPQEILILRKDGKRQKSYQLRRALIESGRLYQCSNCGLNGTWRGKPLMLEVDHLNRNFLDDRAENLAFMCPNCHCQTDGHCGSKGYAEITSVAQVSRAYLERRRKKGAVAERQTRCV